MTDIVERLRGAVFGEQLTLGQLAEAADEIERLRKALDNEKRWNATLEITARKDAEQARSEIERLREDLKIAQGNTDAAIVDYNNALAAIREAAR